MNRMTTVVHNYKNHHFFVHILCALSAFNGHFVWKLIALFIFFKFIQIFGQIFKNVLNRLNRVRLCVDFTVFMGWIFHGPNGVREHSITSLMIIVIFSITSNSIDYWIQKKTVENNTHSAPTLTKYAVQFSLTIQMQSCLLKFKKEMSENKIYRTPFYEDH